MPGRRPSWQPKQLGAKEPVRCRSVRGIRPLRKRQGTTDADIIPLRPDAVPVMPKVTHRPRRMPRRARVQSARIDFPLLEDDPERMQANAYHGLTAFKMIWDSYEVLRHEEARHGANPERRAALATQAYALLNEASRMMNPYRRSRS